MAKLENEVKGGERGVEDNNNNNNNNDNNNNNNNNTNNNKNNISEDRNKGPTKISIKCGGKYQLRPRGLQVRRRSDSEWDFVESLRHHKTRSPQPRPQPLSRYRRKNANARERYRMRQINRAFETLRGALPKWVCSRRAAADLTKITTLRLASAYIRSLQDILEGDAGEDNSWVLSCLLGDSETPQDTPNESMEGQLSNVNPDPLILSNVGQETMRLTNVIPGPLIVSNVSSGPILVSNVNPSPQCVPNLTHGLLRLSNPALTDDRDLVTLFCSPNDDAPVLQENLELLTSLAEVGAVTELMEGSTTPLAWPDHHHQTQIVT